MLPKKSFATDYSYRATRDNQQRLLAGGVKKLWLYFDSKLTTYQELSQGNARGVSFVTIRGHRHVVLVGGGLLKRLAALPKSEWTSAVIDIPKRRQKRIRYLDETIQLRDYDEPIRQIAVTGLGRAQPTLLLTNHADATPRNVIMNIRASQRYRGWAGYECELLPHG